MRTWMLVLVLAAGCGEAATTPTSPPSAELALTRNVATTSLLEARAYAAEVFGGEAELNKVLPACDANYALLREKLKSARDIPRIQMPVIEPDDMEEFDRRLKAGPLDLFPPHIQGQLPAVPTTKAEGEAWVTLGVEDGDPKDDILEAQWTTIPAKDLLPLQSQIWLEKLVGNIKQFGVPEPGSSLLTTTVIVSKEGYILDGHHRFGQAMLANPALELRALHIPLDIDMLLHVGRAYGAAIGNEAKR